MSEADDRAVRRFLRDHYGAKPYALLVGEHTITNIPQERLALMIASILLFHASGRRMPYDRDAAHAAVDQACDALEMIEGALNVRQTPPPQGTR